jgi:hypothetical protein
MSHKFPNAWDASTTETSGPETGSPTVYVPATKRIIAGNGVPARVLNYMAWQTGDNAVQNAQHQGMAFHSAGLWTNTYAACASRTNLGFLVSSTAGIGLTLDGDSSHAVNVLSAIITTPALVHDTGYYVLSLEKGAVANMFARFAHSTTASTQTYTGTVYPFAAATIGANTLIWSTSGTACMAFTFSGTGTLPTSSSATAAGTYASSSTTIWGKTQPREDSTTASGPALFYVRGSATASQYMYTADAVSTTAKTWPATPQDTLADVGYDDTLGVFVAAFYSSAGSVLKFMTSPDGITWTTSTTAAGPASCAFPADGSTRAIAFKVCCGVWFVAATGIEPGGATFVYGTSGARGTRAFGFYSLDQGVTWYPADLDMPACSAASSIRIKHTVNRFMVQHDSGVAVSGKLRSSGQSLSLNHPHHPRSKSGWVGVTVQPRPESLSHRSIAGAPQPHRWTRIKPMQKATGMNFIRLI